MQRGGPMDGRYVVLLPVIVGEPITHLLYRSKDNAAMVHSYALDELTNTDGQTFWTPIYRYEGLFPKSDFPHLKT